MSHNHTESSRRRHVRCVVRCALACGVLLAARPLPGAGDEIGRLDLKGQWGFQLDPEDAGEKEQWQRRELAQSLRLPGSLQEQGFGNDVSVDTKWTGDIVDRSWYTAEKYAEYRAPGNVKVPFWLQPEKHYVGAAWYQRTVDVPDSWKGKRIAMILERPHWETTVWVDDHKIGSRNSLSVPHEYDLSEVLTPGARRLTVRVDNRLKVEVGVNSHSVSDHTQSNWNGVVGRIELEAREPIWISEVRVYPDLKTKSAKVRVAISNTTAQTARGSLVLQATSAGGGNVGEPQPQRIDVALDGKDENQIVCDYSLEADARAWDEFHPVVYQLEVQLDVGAGERRIVDRLRTSFGLREISTEGAEFRLNNRPIYLRGTLECCIFPLTGYPPTDVDSWKHVLGQVKAHGLNHLRFHSWCPPEAAFSAADELGVYYYVECSSWANQGTSVGDGKPVDQWLYDEADRILRAYGNHPSFLLMSYGNEPAGPGQGGQYLGPWVMHQRDKDPRRLYTSAAGWPMIAENQFHVTPQPRIHAWGEGLQDRINKWPPATVADYRDFVGKYEVPVVSHEIGQWCVYPNLEEMSKYTGVLKARNFEVFGDLLRRNHILDQAHDFLMASGKLQALCYKEEIESALRTPGFGGFELLDLHDFPGQGTALVGVLDPFWDSKPYISPYEFRRFCGPIVPLARLPRRIFTTRDTVSAEIELYHFGGQDLKNAVVAWKITPGEGEPLAAGTFAASDFVAGRLSPVGKLSQELRGFAAPRKLRLVVGVEGTDIENDWDLWVYPDSEPTREPSDVLVVSQWDGAARQRLSAGGKVLWLLPPRQVRGDVAIGFSSVFWNTAWTGNQPPHTLGILCRPDHPALAKFPTEYHSNWQWWELVSRSGAMVLDRMPADFRPIVQVVDTWFEARRLGVLCEAKVESGKLMICSMDLASDLDTRPVARQMRHSLFEYMASDKFQPAVEVDFDAIHSLSKPPSEMERLGATARADSEQVGYPASQVLDGNPETIWHTAWEGETRPFPHEIVIEIGKPAVILGVAYLPRQDMSNGRIAEYSIAVSEDGRKWTQSIASGKWSNSKDKQLVRFGEPQTARFVKIVARSEVLGRDWISAAEIELLLDAR